MRDDLFETLRTPPPVHEPLPGTEVRRRGDRLRRRRTALQAVGAVVVVAVIAGGAVTLADRLGGQAKPPVIETPKPTGTASAESPRIRDDFPLLAGLSEPDGDTTVRPPSRTENPVTFGYCGKAAALADGGDRLTGAHVPPAAGFSRELRTYPSEQAAKAAWQRLRDTLTTCTSWTSQGIYEYQARLRPVTDGFQYLVWGEAHVDVSTLVLGGKAILVSSASTEASGEGSASDLAAEEWTRLGQLVPALCEFTEQGCASAPAGDLSDAILLTDADLATAREFMPGEWRQVADRDNPTLDCQGAGLGTLDPEGIAFREWQNQGEGRAATAMLRFRSESAAQDAHRQVVAWLEECPAAMDGARRLTGHTELFEGPAGEHPKAWRVYVGPAPEECTECDSGWGDLQAVTQVDADLVVFSIGGIIDLQFPPEETAWAPELLVTAAARVQNAS